MTHPELEISLYLSNFSKEVHQLTDWQTYKKFRIIWKWCNNIPGMSPKFFRKISHSGPEICLYLSNFSKEVSQLTGRQAATNFEGFRNSLQTFQICHQKISERYLIQNQGYKQMKLVETNERQMNECQTNDGQTQPLLELTPQEGQLKSWRKQTPILTLKCVF